MVYDGANRVILMFGGGTASTYFNDTWAYDIANNTWTNKSPPTAPSARVGHAMTFDEANGRLVLFGGNSAGCCLGDTWVYDVIANTWTQRVPAPAPSARQGHSLAYDSVNRRVVLFGGEIAPSTYDNETWAYDTANNSWAKQTPALSPSSRTEYAMTFDMNSKRVLVHGGNTGVALSSETWEYDLLSNTWTNRNPGTSPARDYHSMAYDASAGRTLVFGGCAVPNCSTRSDETWSYDYGLNNWTLRSPSLAPSRRYYLRMAYDPSEGKTVLFGGSAAPPNYLGDTWIFSAANAVANVGNTSSFMDSGLSNGVTYFYRVAARNSAGLGPPSNEVNATPAGVPVVPGPPQNLGATGGPARVSLAWGAPLSNGSSPITGYGLYRSPAPILSLNSWINITPPGGPTPRGVPGFAYDSDRDMFILFGGTSGTWNNETWIMNGTSGTWTQVFPASAPTPRYGHAMTYDQSVRKVVLFGGWTQTGHAGDTWTYNSTSNAWTSVSPAYSPSARDEAAMVYDPVHRRSVLFGGVAAPFPTPRSNETWLYDGALNNWTNATPPKSPEGRHAHTLSYDPLHDAVVLFGGAEVSTAVNNTWTFHMANGTWVNRTSARAPSPRTQASMAYDPANNLTILYGGSKGGLNPNAETWAYDAGTNQWTNMTSGSAPQARWQHAAAYDQKRGRIVVFGGYTGSTLLGDTWEYRDAALLVQLGIVLNYTDLNVTPGVLYHYRASAKNAVGEGSLSNNASAIPLAGVNPPSAPQGPQALRGNANISLTWTAPASDGGSPVTRYKVYRGLSSGDQNLTPITQPVASSYLDQNLANGLTYFYRISAVNAIGDGPLSTEVNATPATQPTPPLNLQASPGNAEANLSWVPPSSSGGLPITNYRIYRGLTSGGEIFLMEVGNVTSYHDTGLTNGQSYYYKVSGKNEAGEGALSSETSASPRTVPGPPVNLVATATKSAVNLSWSPPGSDGGALISNYRIYRGSSSGGGTLLKEVGTINWFEDLNVSAGAVYFYEVSARNVAGEGARSAESSGRVPNPPLVISSNPANGSTGVPLNAVILIQFNQDMDSSATAGAFSIVPSVVGGNVSVSGMNLTWTHSGLFAPNTAYTVTISTAAKSSSGDGMLSPFALSFTSSSPTAPSAPGNLTAAGKQLAIDLSWTTPVSNGGTPLIEYRVLRGTIRGSLVPVATVALRLVFSDTNVTPGVRYYYAVQARNAVGWGALSTEVSAIALPGPNQPPVAAATALQGFDALDGQNVNVTLRVAGTKWQSVTLTILANGTQAGALSILREAGAPDDQSRSIDLRIDRHRSYEGVLLYQSQSNGGTPVWLRLRFANATAMEHYTFVAVAGDTQTRTIDLDERLQSMMESTHYVQFSGTSSYDLDGTLTVFSWDLGDGTSAISPTYMHEYDDDGQFTVKLTVTDDDNATDADTVVVGIDHPRSFDQAASLLLPTLVPEGTALTLVVNASAVSVSNATGSVRMGAGLEANDIPESFAVFYSELFLVYAPTISGASVEWSGSVRANVQVLALKPTSGFVKAFGMSVPTGQGHSERASLSVDGDRFTLRSIAGGVDYDMVAQRFVVGSSGPPVAITKMPITSPATHTLVANSWQGLGQDPNAATLLVDDNGDGVPDRKANLAGTTPGNQVVLVPIEQPFSPVLTLLAIVGFGLAGLLGGALIMVRRRGIAPTRERRKRTVVGKARAVTRCGICHKRINVGDGKALCTCDRSYHSECARDEKVCPSCGKEFEQGIGEEVIDELFLVYKDGRLIRHVTRRLVPDRDHEILSSMLAAVQEFVKDSMAGTAEGEALEELKIGRYRIAIARGEHLFLAAVTEGGDAERFRDRLKAMVNGLETRHKDKLPKWEGKPSSFPGTEEDLKRLFS